MVSMKIYTKTGDSGKTRLVSGAEVSKADARLNSYGSLDELNSCLGWALQELEALPDPAMSAVSDRLLKVQHQLFNLGSLLACDKIEMWQKLPQIQPSYIADLEQEIDRMTALLPPLKQFILPGGVRAACALHLARTICRRAERETVHLSERAQIPELSLIYLNRLSDYLFVVARMANWVQKHPDQVWESNRS